MSAKDETMNKSRLAPGSWDLDGEELKDEIVFLGGLVPAMTILAACHIKDKKLRKIWETMFNATQDAQERLRQIGIMDYPLGFPKHPSGMRAICHALGKGRS